MVIPNRRSKSSEHRPVWNEPWCSADRHQRPIVDDCWEWSEQWEDTWVLSTWKSPDSKLELAVRHVQHWQSTTSRPRENHRWSYLQWTSTTDPSNRSRADWSRVLRHASGLRKKSRIDPRAVVFTWNLHREISISEDFEGRRMKWTDGNGCLTETTVRIDNLSAKERD